MNCAHCGTTLSTIDVEKGHSCSEEHSTAHGEALLLDLIEVPLFAVGKLSSASFGENPFSIEFPLQVEMPSGSYFEWTESKPGGPLLQPLPMSVRPVWQARTSSVPFLTSHVLPNSVIISTLRLNNTGRYRNGLFGLWGTWSPLTKCALFIVPVVVAAGTHFIVGGTNAPPPPEVPTAKVLIDDFKSGLNQWQGAEGRAKPWKWESSEGATPQSLAVFLPALGIPDYKLEFTADALKNSVSWATQIKDLQNYQAYQLTLRKSTEESQFSFSRYKVVAGREGPRTQVPLQIVPPSSNVWRVKLMSVRDSRTLWINDQIANSWTDAEDETGGIGFFAGNADQFVLKSVKVSEELTLSASR